MLSRPPAKTEPTASTIIGTVIERRRLVRVRLVAVASTQRFSPKNVMSITRVM